jgi:hypothetical protein
MLYTHTHTHRGVIYKPYLFLHFYTIGFHYWGRNSQIYFLHINDPFVPELMKLLIKLPTILSRFYGCVTNNNGFRIGWLDLLTPSCTVSLNPNQLEMLTINDCLNLSPFSFSFFHNCQLRSLTLLCPLCADPTENTAFIVDKACLLHRCLATDLLLFRAFDSEGMCLATRCLPMGMARTTQKIILAILFYCCVRVFRALRINGSTCHKIIVTTLLLLLLSHIHIILVCILPMSRMNYSGFVRMGEFCTHPCNTDLNQQNSSSNNTFEV